MAFENGNDINEYIKGTIKAYNEDNKIFQKTLEVLNTFMLRKDWPLSYKEFESVAEYILNDNPEMFVKSIKSFSSQEYNGNEMVQGWKESLNKSFVDDAIIFCETLHPVIENYYAYMNNPQGIGKILKSSISDYWVDIRITRVDGESLDLRLNDYDRERLANLISGSGEYDE